MNIKNYIISLGILQLFIGIGAVPCGLMMMLDPSGQSMMLPIDMLRNSPFPNFFIPGIVLFSVNGVLSLACAFLTLRRYRLAGQFAMMLGIFLMCWIAAQVWWLGVHWLHVVYLVLGAAEWELGVKVRRSMKFNK